MAGGEHEPEHVVLQRNPGHAVDVFQVPGYGPVPLPEPLGPAPGVDGLSLGDGGEPGGRIVRCPGFRPLDQGLGQGFLGQILGEANVPGGTGEGRDDVGTLDAPQGINPTPDRSHSLFAHSVLATDSWFTTCSVPVRCSRLRQWSVGRLKAGSAPDATPLPF
jgi:hypothetical protein